MGKIHRLPEKKPEPISEEQEEREFLEAQRGVPQSDAPAMAEVDGPLKTRRSKRKPYQFPFKCLPDLWIKKLRGARYVATWKLAAHLLEQDWKQYRKPFLEGEPIALSNGWLKACNLSRQCKSRGLSEMSDLGLIHVQYRLRKSPLVTLIRPPPAEEDI